MSRALTVLYTLKFIILFELLSLKPSYSRTNFNVLNFGAKPNGLVYSTQAFVDAWNAACNSYNSTFIYVPKGRYLLGPLRFEGDDCKTSDLTLRIDGTLIGPEDYRLLGKEENWISFVGVNGVSVIGGTLDAKGPALWACKAEEGNCPEGATTVRFIDSNNIRVKGMLSLNSQLFHIVINRCQNVQLEDVRIIAAGESPNTDGIHVQLSNNVEIRNASIKTGDDCISIGPGTKNLWIEQVTCGPGHGISIGSLAKDTTEEGVQNVTVKKTVLIGTDNGLRIKSWPRHSSGFVQRVRFLGAIMVNVKYPILIDQNYCPGDTDCPSEETGIQIKDVIYQGILGTSASKIAIKMDCNPKYPCTLIRMQTINLTYSNAAAQSMCTNVVGKALGFVQPTGCL